MMQTFCIFNVIFHFHFFKGERKERKEIPKETPSVYAASTRPLTASREYGSRVQTPPAKEMTRLQSQMSRGMRRNKDLLYYD